MEPGTAVPHALQQAAVTEREAEVFWLVGARLHNREIADELVISVRTVESHVTALLRKLAVGDRGDLIRLAARLRAGAGRRAPPRPLDSFVGREGDLAQLRTTVAVRRLVTLVGPPGVGKSRLALELARPAQPPAVFVDLAVVRSAADVAGAFLRALGILQPVDDARTVLREALAVDQAWLVVDNCDHVVDAVGGLVHELLTSTDGLRVLATSRRPLDVAGEQVHVVAPLPLPAGDSATAAAVFASPAGRLFAERARAAAGDIDVHASPAAVAALCRRLDGLPLAIELAAARLRTFAPQELLARLDDRLGLLGDVERQGGGSRHPTLEAAIAVSYDLLGPVERRLLRRLSVFAGQFAYDDVVAVAAGDDLPADDIARGFSRLADRSLLGRRRSEGDETTFRLLDSIRHYAARRLADEDLTGTVVRRHAEHHLSAAAALGPALRGPLQTTALRWLDRRWDDIRQAVRWALLHDHPLAWGFIVGIGSAWTVVGIRGDVAAWLDELLAAGLPDPADVAVAAAMTAAQLLDYTDGARAMALARRAVELADDLGAALPRARSRIALGAVCARRADPGPAAAELRTALDLLGDGHDWDRAFALQSLGRATRDLDAALAHLTASATLFAALDDAVKHANVRYMMAELCLRRGARFDDARAWLAQAHRLAVRTGNEHEQLHAAVQRARLDQLEGEADAAQGALTALLPAFRRIGDRRCVCRCLSWLGELELARGERARAVALLVEAVAVADVIDALDEAVAARRRLALARGTTGRAASGEVRGPGSSGGGGRATVP